MRLLRDNIPAIHLRLIYRDGLVIYIFDKPLHIECIEYVFEIVYLYLK